MFGSRRHKGRPPQPPLNASTANPNAATAALSAFKRRESNGSLSAAAAAAALKARPTTPTNVAEVQTKRTARRSASVSSAGTAPELGERPGGGLQRRGSSASLTERTFRSQSPHRPSSSGGQPRSSFNTEDMPPVPSIPKDVEAREAGKTGKSLGFKSPPLRVASQRLSKEGSGSWFGAAKEGDPSNVRTSDAALANPPPQAEREGRPSSRGSSINFSYPARVRVGSPPPDSPTIAEEEARSQPPPPQPQPEVQRRTSKRASTLSPARGGGVRSPRPASIASDRELVYDPNSRRMVSRGELLAVEQNVLDASEKPRPKKKKAQTASKAGSHLAQGTMGRPHGSAVDNGVENEAQKAAAASLKSRRAEEHHQVPQEDEYEYEQPAMEVVQASPRQAQRRIISPEPARQGQRASLSPASNAPEVYASQSQPTERRSSGQFLGRKPSIVREEEEPEVEELDSQTVVPTRQAAFAENPAQQREAQQTHIISPQPIAIPHAAPAELPAAPTPPPAEAPAAFRIDRGAVSQPEAIRRERAHSNSPARTAHFGPVQDSLTVRHSPPPRSISPRKSALKQQSPSRGASPEDDTSEASGTGFQSQEPVLPRKKSVRVSFDDENTVVVGQSAAAEQTDSPILPSPQNSRRVPWFSNITRNKKKELPPLDDDEVMQPRPALPSFGSVREKKQIPKEPEERPLVRPIETVHSPPVPGSPTVKPSIPSTAEAETVGQSSDHAIGAIFQEQGPRTEANISKLREPLPPVVTSIEGSGYVSDTSSSSDSESELIADTPRSVPEMSQASTSLTEPDNQPQPLNGSAEIIGQDQAVEAKDFAEEEPKSLLPDRRNETSERDVPSIAITQPSPGLPEEKGPQQDYLDVPGGFPDTDSDIEESTRPLDTTTTAPQSVVSSTPVRRVTFEPVIQKDDTKAASQTASTALATALPIVDETDDSDTSAIYSDAYEDLSDIEGDGFQSLDAVVESPLITTPPKHILAQARAAQLQGESPSPSPKPVEANPLELAPTVLEPTQSPPDDWETAKAYWRSLTADKRAQLEKEAMEDAGIEGDLEEVQQQEDKKPRRKKSVEKRTAEKKIIQEQRNIDPERTYMIKPGTRVEVDAYTSGPTKTLRKQQQAPTPAASQPATRMRKSMRGAEQPEPRATTTVAAGGAGGAPRMRKSLRTNGPEKPQQRSAASQGSRPVSYHATSSTTRQTTGHYRTMSDQSSQASAQAAAGASSIVQPKLRRRGSDSSESSFKRARARSGEGFGFRKTMRGQGHEPSNSMDSGRPSSSRFSLRSLSPTGSPFRRSSTVDSPPVSMGNRMKTSMRGSAEPQRKGSRLSSFGLSSRPKSSGKGKKSSRFGDSSDEDEPRQTFRSRFDDSSDEDAIPEKLPPLALPKNARGNIAATRTKIPTSQTVVEEDEQSSELPDSDEEQKPQRTDSSRQNIGTGTLQRSRSGRGALVSSPTSPTSPGGSRPSGQNRRSSFMSALRRKKPDGAGKISRGEVMDSAARRDTNLERSASELNAIRSTSLRGQAGSPKLQKRVGSFPTPTRGGSWPLPDEEDDEAEMDGAEDEEKTLRRPGTSGNLEGGGAAKASSRPGFMQRRTMSTQGTIDTEGVGGEKKKKKFGALRRMFRLDD